MNTPIVHDALENSAQRYLNKLRCNKQSAADTKQSALNNQAVNATALAEANAWKTIIDAYWENVQHTQAIYKDVDNSIQKLLRFSNVITDNVHQVRDSIEILVCVMREIAKQTDGLKKRIGDLKSRLSGTNNNNAYYTLILDFETKVKEAIIASEAAIKAVLELLREIYLLSISLSGKVSVDRLHTHISDFQSIEIGNMNWMEFFYKIDLPALWRSRNFGLEENIKHLSLLLTKDMAYPLSSLSKPEIDSLPFLLTADAHVPTFPIDKQPYYISTQTQRDAADKKQKKAKENNDYAVSYLNRAEAQYSAADAALTSAEAAKTATGGL